MIIYTSDNILVIYGNIFIIYVSKMVLFLKIDLVSIMKIVPIIIFKYLCFLIDFSGIVLDIVYIIKLRYMNDPTIH